ncbi:hypothetical protein WJX72_008830 [[Myrmecia] bisecta]|uniref:Uncharacterized protein n=1 Tax=[Myrmecia] bisecta TaxID=41462 RepID=A0AAW1Q674_9CHLO
MGGSIWPVQRTAPATLFNVSQTLSKRPSRAGPCRQRQSALLTSCADLSAGFLETVATMALKTRLKAYQQVETSMNCTAWGLLQGAVEGVQIRGQGWTSPLGLSARILEVTLGSARLDMGVLLRQQDIMLQNTPQGAARIVFNSTDFGNLLVHPLVKQLASRAIQGSGFLFDKYSVCICPDQGTSGAVEFSGVWTGDGHMYHLLLSPQGQRAHVSTRLADNGAASYAFFALDSVDVS